MSSRVHLVFIPVDKTVIQPVTNALEGTLQRICALKSTTRVEIALIPLLKPRELLIPRSRKSLKFHKLVQPRYTAGTGRQICGCPRI